MALPFGASRPETNPFGAWRPKKVRKPVRKPRRPGQSIEDWVKEQVEEMIQAQKQALLEQQRIYESETARLAEEELGRGRSLAAAIQGMNLPGTIQNVYGNAAQGIGGLAQGFSGETRSLANNQAAEAMNMLSGTGQEGAVRNQGENMGNVLYGVGGFIPGKELGETGAAFAADAARQPGFALADAGRAAQDIRSQRMAGLADFAAQMAEIESQRPMLARELEGERRSMLEEERQRQFALEDRRMEMQDRDREWFLKMAAYYNAIGDDKRAEQYLRLAQQREQRQVRSSQGLDATGRPKPGYRVNPRTGQVEKIPTKRAGSKPKAVNWGDIQADMANELDDFVEEVPNPDPYAGGTVSQKISRAEAYARLWNEYSGMVKNKGRLKRLINKILDRAGFEKPSSSSSGDGLYPGIH